MNFALKLLAMTFGLSLATSAAYAQTSRVAFVDIQRVVAQSNIANTRIQKTEDRVLEIQVEIEEQRAKLVSLRAEIRKEQGVLAETEVKKKRDEAAKIEKKITDLEYEAKQEMQGLQTSVVDPMIRSISVAIEEVAKEKNIDIVVQSEAVYYGSTAADITSDVAKKINDLAKTSGGGSAAAGSSDNSTRASSSDKETTSSGNAYNKDSIIPSIPLRSRPVDRQSD